MISTRKKFFDMLKKSRIIKEIVDFFCSEKTNIDWLIVHKHYLSFLLKMSFENEILLAYLLLWDALSENRYRL